MYSKLIFALLLILSKNVLADMNIKGIYVDKVVDCEYLKSLDTRKGNFYNACEEGKELWFHEISFLDKKAALWITQDEDSYVTSVSVRKFNFNDCLLALTNKFGEPEIVESVTKNRMGASFNQIEAIWKEDNLILKLTKHYLRINEPSLSLYGLRYAEKIKNRVPSNDI
jgi:hypothetical protein